MKVDGWIFHVQVPRKMYSLVGATNQDPDAAGAERPIVSRFRGMSDFQNDPFSSSVVKELVGGYASEGYSDYASTTNNRMFPVTGSDGSQRYASR